MGLVSGFSDVSFVMNLPIEDGVDFFVSELKRRREKRIWDLYVALYPWMDKEHFETFEQFRDKMTGDNISKTPASDILEKARRIREKAGG